MEPTLSMVEDNVVVATSELIVAEDPHGPTSLAQYWKLDPWSQGYVVALEAERCQSGERPSQPLPEALARRGAMENRPSFWPSGRYRMIIAS